MPPTIGAAMGFITSGPNLPIPRDVQVGRFLEKISLTNSQLEPRSFRPAKHRSPLRH